MSHQDLELEVKKLFRKSRQPASHSSRFRLLSLLKRGLHELAVRDFINFIGNMLSVMVILLSALAKGVFQPVTKPLKGKSHGR